MNKGRCGGWCVFDCVTVTWWGRRETDWLPQLVTTSSQPPVSAQCTHFNTTTAHNIVYRYSVCTHFNSTTAHNIVHKYSVCTHFNTTTAHNIVYRYSVCTHFNSTTAHNIVYSVCTHFNTTTEPKVYCTHFSPKLKITDFSNRD